MKNLYLVTGFLGSGKTTFLNNVLRGYTKKSAVIVNEFGQQGIDGTLIAQNEDIHVEEINNGSIFCCCRMIDFANALAELSKTDVETIFVEASGLADPSNLKDIVEGANSRCDDDYIFTGTVCIVDALNFLKLSCALPSLISQVEHSDYILINKCDSAISEKIEETRAKLLEINSTAMIYETSYSKLPELPDKVLTLKDASPSGNSPTTRPKTKVILPKALTDKNIEKFIGRISKKAFRAKGFVTYNGQKKYLDVVGDTYTLSDAESNQNDKIVTLALSK